MRYARHFVWSTFAQNHENLAKNERHILGLANLYPPMIVKSLWTENSLSSRLFPNTQCIIIFPIMLIKKRILFGRIEAEIQEILFLL